MTGPAVTVLLGAGYAASIAVIARFVPVVRERRWRWLVVHHLGVLAVAGGWWAKRRLPAAAVNLSWLFASSAWYVLGGRRRTPPTSGPGTLD